MSSISWLTFYLFLVLSFSLGTSVEVRPLITKRPLLPSFLDDPSFGKFAVPKGGKEVLIFNQKRSKDVAVLKLSFNGSSIVEHVEAKEDNQWIWKLNDGQMVEYSIEKVENSRVIKNTIRIPGIEVGGKEICFHYGFNGASWYPGHHSITQAWPLNTTPVLPPQNFANIRNFVYNPKAEDFQLILEQLFITSSGFAIVPDSNSPLFLRRDPNEGEPLLCFSTNNSLPYNPKITVPKYKNLTIRIFAGENVRVVTDYVVHRSGLIPKPSAIPDEAKFTNPTFSDYAQGSSPVIGRTEVMDLVKQITAHGFPIKSEVMLDSYLQREYGDIELNEKQYQDSKKLIDELHSQGFRVGLGVSPFIRNKEITRAQNDSRSDYFIRDIRDNTPTMLVDFSNPEACSWYEYLLRGMHYQNGIDSFQLSLVSIRWLLNFKDPQVHAHPGSITTKYVETGARLGNRVVSDVGYKTQHLPNFVRFSLNRYFTFYQQQLDSLIPNALSVSMAGYSFFIPYQIGGYHREMKPSEELYIRWVQAVTFMPSMAFLHAPWAYPNQSVVNITRKFLNLHTEHAPTLIELAKKRVQDGSPIIRPLWYVAPEESETYKIGDQFMVGNDLLVAPVLKMSQNERSVYLPEGVWVDQHGTMYDGKVRVKVKAPLEELPYFKRLITV